MPCPPLRFIHAANVFLDVPVWVPGEISASVREVAAAATRTAFRNVVRACLDRDVDFLLLCGDTFVDADHGLAARVTLRDGLEQLNAVGVPVFVLPGAHDPADAWRSIPDLPESVTVVDGEEDSVEVTRDGSVVAIVGPDPRDFPKSPGSDAFLDPVRISLRYVATDRPPLVAEAASFWTEAGSFGYVALGGETPAVEWGIPTGIVHHPGSPQPPSPEGANGSCTLVEVDESREFQLTPLPTAAIRFEHLKKSLDEGDAADNLLQTLPGQLALRPAVDGEQVRCVVWTVDGDGPLWTALQSPAARAKLERALRREAGVDAPVIVHHMELARSTGDGASADGIAGDFERAFAETWRKLPASDPSEAEPKLAASATLDEIARQLDELASHRPEWKPRLDQLAPRLSAPAVVASANHAVRRRLECDTPEGPEA
jgi:DNA repair protein SbcD/Mre11